MLLPAFLTCVKRVVDVERLLELCTRVSDYTSVLNYHLLATRDQVNEQVKRSDSFLNLPAADKT